jgi:hypothetical protein
VCMCMRMHVYVHVHVYVYVHSIHSILNSILDTAADGST